MRRTGHAVVLVCTVAASAAAASVGAVLAQSQPTPLQVCTSSLASCSNDLRACRSKLEPPREVVGSKGGFTWREADLRDMQLLLKRAVQAEKLDVQRLSATTRSLLERTGEGATAAPDAQAEALREVAAQVRAKAPSHASSSERPAIAPTQTLQKSRAPSAVRQ